MARLRKLSLFTVATVAAVFLIVWSDEAFGFRTPVSAFLVNWIAMSWAAIVGQAVHVSLPPKYYAIKGFERTGQVYERVGIRLFKGLVRRGPLAMFSPTLRFPKERTTSALRELDHKMREAETGHLFVSLLMFLFIGHALLRGWFDAAGWLLLFNVLLNGYPIMLQRYNRIKLQGLIERQGA